MVISKQNFEKFLKKIEDLIKLRGLHEIKALELIEDLKTEEKVF